MLHDYLYEEGTHVPETDEEEVLEEQHDLLGMLKLPEPLICCCDTLWFMLLTFVFLISLVTDIGLMLLYGVQRHHFFLIVSVSVFVFASLLTSVVYSVHIKHEVSPVKAIFCFVANWPLQSGMVWRRLKHTHSSAAVCCRQQNTHQSKKHSNIRWQFIKLDLLFGILNCCPQMVLNILHIFIYKDVYLLQYISLISCLLLLLLAAVMHEKMRKERARNSPYGCLPMLCIIFYRIFVFSARVIAFAVFYYYFGLLIGAIIIPHFILVFVFFTYLYRQVWKVQYYKILSNSIYCILAYFPIHCEYRPEGEIVMYYIIFLLENIIMVGLAYVIKPFRQYSEYYGPWSEFHKMVTALVLLLSSIGLIFMGTYYFFFHGANETISDTSLSWLAKLCEWTTRKRKTTHHLYTVQSNSSTQSSFSNPMCRDNQPWLVSQPDEAMRENITSPVYEDIQYHQREQQQRQSECHENQINSSKLACHGRGCNVSVEHCSIPQQSVLASRANSQALCQSVL